MISVTELRAGKTFQENGQPYLVVKYEHTKMGRGTANIKVRVRNLKSGVVTERTFISGAKVEEISTRKRKLEFLYFDGAEAHFMDPKSFEQFSLPIKLLGQQVNFLKIEALVDAFFVEDELISIELAPKIKFRVKETGPGAKGNSATNIFKTAELENGMKIKVPLFIKTGEEIWVDTKTGEYQERVR